MGDRNLDSATKIGTRAIEDSVRELDNKSTEAIELRTVELANRIADFLHERDMDIIMLASSRPDPKLYYDVYQSLRRDVIVHGPWPPDLSDASESGSTVSWKNPDNKTSWRHKRPCDFKRVSRPLYREITFVDLRGREKIKIRNGTAIYKLKDVSKRANTYLKAEDYFKHLGGLKRGEIYVSRVIGAYIKGWLYKTPEGIKVRPESAYAGKENPYGKRFEGIARWATPVFDSRGKKTGYVTMALDHTHVMEFTDHVIPTEERFSDISDAGSGNYAFLWDFEDQCISHPRDFFICGYDPETGREVPGWLSQESYDEFSKSGLPLKEFVKNLLSFRSFSFEKRGSKEQMEAGNISLDCRILDMAPQCEGWHRGTQDGGSGSFLIFWSGLWKLTTYATVPYYTGMYGKSKRGFGYVTIGANVDDFHRAANVTKAYITKSIRDQGKDIRDATNKASRSIEESSQKNRRLMTLITLISALVVVGVSILLSLTITRPLRRLTAGAEAMSRGELEQFIEVGSRDELGQLAKTFNEMAAAVSEVDKMKSEFVSTASHELRTPIHAMLLGVSGVVDGYSGTIDEEVAEDLKLVEEGIDRLSRLVENFLDLSRIEARKIELNITEVEVDDVVNSAIEEVAGLINAHGHSVAKDIRAPIPLLNADRDRLVQVIINLLSNSIKYTPRHGKIIVRAEMEDDSVVFTIADNGYGIPPWASEKIFEKFFQADQIMSQKVGGSGLGLTITKWIVEEHGGSIGMLSPVPEGMFKDFPLGGERKGAVFTIHIPLAHLTEGS